MVNEASIKEWFTTEVKERMNEADLRPYHMAYLCQFKHDSVYGYLNGVTLPNPWNLVLMAETFECCVDELLGYEEPDYISWEPYQASKAFVNKDQYAICFADRFKRYIAERCLTLEDISSKANISMQTIKKWTGARPHLPRIGDLLHICDALNCTPSELLGY